MRGLASQKKNRLALQAEIDQLAGLVGSIESEQELAVFYDHFAAIDNSLRNKTRQDAVYAYLDQIGPDEWQQNLWISVSIYTIIGKSPAFFLKKFPSRLYSKECLEEILGIASIISNLALQGRLHILAEDNVVKRAMETRGRSRGAEILKAYMAVYKKQTGIREWDYDTLVKFGCHVHQKAYGDDIGQEDESG